MNTKSAHKRKLGQPEFVPSKEQRGWVEAMTGLRMTHDEMRLVIINPHTGRHISRDTLTKAFPDELNAGKARLKHLIGSKFLQRLNEGDAWAIQFGFRNVFGWRDKDNGESGDGYSRLPLDQLVETLAVQAKALGLHIDLSYKFHDPGRFGGTVEPKLIEGTVKGSEEEKR